MAIVLAAGGSRRFGAANKMLAPFAGAPLVTHAVAAARAAPIARMIVVVGADHARVAAAARRALARVVVVRALDHREGVAASLRAARSAMWPVEREAVVFLGDMPAVPRRLARRLVREGRGAAVVRPRHRGVPGHPVLVRGRLLGRMASLHGDHGLAGLAKGGRTHWIEAGKGCIADVDRRRDLARAGRRM